MAGDWAGSPWMYIVLVLAGAVASAINAVAGGGSLVSFPTLVALGIPPLPANATNAVALWPGSLAGALGYREEFAKTKSYFAVLVAPTLVGAILGSWLLVVTDQSTFQRLVPFLVLGATVLLALQPRVQQWAAKREGGRQKQWGIFLQFLVALYGGYFGAGMGIMILAAMSLYVKGTLHEMNALKNWLGLIINLAASVLLVTQGLVWLVPGVCLMVGAMIGGYAGARLSLRVSSDRLRILIVVYGLAMSVWFFVRGFL